MKYVEFVEEVPNNGILPISESDNFEFVYYFTGGKSLSILKHESGSYNKWGFVNVNKILGDESIGRPGSGKLCFVGVTSLHAVRCAVKAGRTLYGAKTFTDVIQHYAQAFSYCDD